MKEKGICFKCDGKFSVRHRCPNRELNVFVVQEVEDLSDLPEETEVTAGNEKVVEAEITTLSLNSLDQHPEL